MMRSALSWTSRLGALVLLLAQAGPSAAELGRWSPLGPFGAPVSVVAIDPLTPSYVLVYSENDGLFHVTRDHGRAMLRSIK